MASDWREAASEYLEATKDVPHSPFMAAKRAALREAMFHGP